METAKKLKIFIAVFVVLAVILGGFLVFKKNYSPKSENNITEDLKQFSRQQTATSTLLIEKKIITAPKIDYYKNFALYKNNEFGFEIKYPDNWQVSAEPVENIRGEQTKGFFFKKRGSDLRFAILPRDGLSYGLETAGTSTRVFIGGSAGIQTQYILKDGRRLWLLHPQYGLHNWSQDIGRIDILSSADDPAGDTIIFEKMLNSFKLSK